MKPSQKPSFLIYKDWKDAICGLADVDMAQLFRAIFAFQTGEELPPMSSMANALFSVFKPTFERDAAAYERKCATLRNNINKRWQNESQESGGEKTIKQEGTNKYKSIQTYSKEPDMRRSVKGIDGNDIVNGNNGSEESNIESADGSYEETSNGSKFIPTDDYISKALGINRDAMGSRHHSLNKN